MLEFSVNHQVLTKVSNNALVANSQRYLEARFKFSADWTGLHKIAHFRRQYPGESTERYIDVVLGEDGVCRVPDAVLEQPGTFIVGLYGQTVNNNGVNEIVITCNEVDVHLAYAYLPQNQLPYTPMDGVVGQAYEKIVIVYNNLSAINLVKDNITVIQEAPANAQTAVTAKNAAQTAAGDAQTSATSAGTSATSAASSATLAQQYAEEAYRVTPEGLKWCENFYVDEEGYLCEDIDEEDSGGDE